MKHLIFTVLSLLSLQQYAQQLLTESEIDKKNSAMRVSIFSKATTPA